jgi:hypothetical protein
LVKRRLLTTLGAAALLLGTGSVRARTGVEPSSDISDLKSLYHGVLSSQTNEVTFGSVELDVLAVDGKDFSADLDSGVIFVSGGVGPRGGPTTVFSMRGSVSPKGKVKMKGEPEGLDLELSINGTLSDGGALIIGKYTLKSSTTTAKGITWLAMD